MTRKMHWYRTSRISKQILTLCFEWWGKRCCPPHIQPARTVNNTQNKMAEDSSCQYICCYFIQKTNYFEVLMYYIKYIFQSNNQALWDNLNQIKGTIYRYSRWKFWKPPRSWTMHVGQGRSFCYPHLPLGLVLDKRFDHQTYDGVQDCCIGVVGSLCLCWILKVDACLWPGFLPLTVTAPGTQKAATFDLWKTYPDALYKTCPSTHKPGSQICLCGGRTLWD